MLDGAGAAIPPKQIPYAPSGTVVLQGNAPVCGPACAAMVISDSSGRAVSLESVIGSFSNGVRPTGVNAKSLESVIGSFSNGVRPTGVNANELSAVISQAGVKNTVETTMFPGQLDAALESGHQVIVNVKGHFVIVDSQLEVNGVAYYMTRDPYVGPRGVQSTLLQTVMYQGVNAVIVGR
ncbi:hypothetical protein [Chromobacterium violaceum]|uniref:hypothetical protein n=1 Tax=Chromobacterium violaceum TaxID=536 RepID=UPI0012D3D376|nr:hypothetical protein [Chromobacterium violaceum]